MKLGFTFARMAMENIFDFSPDFWSVFFSMVIFAPVAAMIVRASPGMDQLFVRKIFGITAVVAMAYNFFFSGSGWTGIVETALLFTAGTYLFAVVAEGRFVPFGEIWSGPTKKSDAKEKRRES